MSLGKFSAFGDIVRSTRPSYEYRATPENVELIAELEAVEIPSFFKKKKPCLAGSRAFWLGFTTTMSKFMW